MGAGLTENIYIHLGHMGGLFNGAVRGLGFREVGFWTVVRAATSGDHDTDAIEDVLQRLDDGGLGA